MLLAEDDASMRRVLVDVLRGHGHEVLAVADGATLMLELARSSRFNFDAVDAVVSDVRMPLCSGIHALETIHKLRPGVPFVLLTAFGDAEMHARAAALGVTMLDKPVSMHVLASAVADAVASSRQRRAARTTTG